MTVPLLRVCYRCGFPTPGRHASSCPDVDSGVVTVSKHTAPEEVTRLRRVLSQVDYALRMLVSLKDGPRDEHYEREKAAAWQLGREAVAVVDAMRGNNPEGAQP